MDRNIFGVYLEDVFIELVAVIGTAGLASGAVVKRGEASKSGEDPDGLSDVSGKAGGCPVNVVLDLKTIVKYY